MSEPKESRESWSGNLGFILAAAGSAIGLGNIWKFPYITGENGGGAFVLIYLVCIAVIGLPVMLCEICLGRHTRRNPVGAFHMLSPRTSRLAHLIGAALVLCGSALILFANFGWGALCIGLGALVFLLGWTLVGAMGVLAGFLILSFYSVVAGWTLGYVVMTASGKTDPTPARQPKTVLEKALVETLVALPTADNERLKSLGLAPDKKEAGTRALAAARLSGFVRERLPDSGLQVPAKPSESDIGEMKTALCNALAATDSDTLTDWLNTQCARDGTLEPKGEKDARRKLLVRISGIRFKSFAGNPWWAIGCHFIFMVMCVGIVYMGVKNGIERASKLLMPLLFLLLIALMIRGLSLPGAIKGVRFFLTPDFNKITTQSVLIALGHAFFSLSLGMGAMITYGSYVRKDANLLQSSLSIVVLDTLVALLAGLAIFPAVFALGFDPDQGPGLVFHVLPTVFAGMPLGPLWGFVFFLLVLVAALTSGISLLEVVTAYFVDELKMPRKVASVVFGTVIFFIGSICAVSGAFFDRLDHIASNWLLPLGGLAISVFVGWIWGTKHAVDEIRKGSHNFADVHFWSLLAGLKDDPSHSSEIHVVTLASIWGVFIRFISPIAVMIAFLHTVGWLGLKSETKPPSPTPPAIERPAAGPADKGEPDN